MDLKPILLTRVYVIKKKKDFSRTHLRVAEWSVGGATGSRTAPKGGCVPEALINDKSLGALCSGTLTHRSCMNAVAMVDGLHCLPWIPRSCHERRC